MISHHVVRSTVVAVLCGGLAALASAQREPDGSSLRASADTTPSPVPKIVTPPISKEMRGDIFMARKMFREAIDTFRECPPSPVVENKIGIAFHQLMQLDLAKKSYERAIKLDSKYPEAINNLGTVYYSERKYGKSIRLYKRALKLNAKMPSFWVNLGTAYFSKHDFKRAVPCYDKAMTLDPDVFEHHSQYGTTLEERSVEDRARFHLYLAKSYAQRGDKDKAILYLRKAMEEGLKDRKKIPEMPEFASLKTDAAFKDLLVQDPKPL
jgi:tetratricopeptide (TPR) repeat protein